LPSENPKNPLISVKKELDNLGFLDRGEENLDVMARFCSL